MIANGAGLARSVERCSTHPTREAVAICGGCGQLVCTECHDADEIGVAICPACGLARDPAKRPRPVPLEDPESAEHLLLRLLRTLKAQVVSPLDFYARLGASRALLTPFVAGYACLVVGLVVSYGYAMVLGGPAQEVLEKVATDIGTDVDTLAIARLFGVPFEALFRMGLYSAVLHFAARIVGGTATFRKTFQIYAYSSVAALLYLVPVVGSVIVLAVQIMAQFAGIRVLHHLTPGRAALACAIPLAMALLGGGGA